MRSQLCQLATLYSLGTKLKAPGTWGTLAAVPFIYILGQFSPLVHLGVTLLLVPVGFVAAEFYRVDFQREDPPEVIIDEFIGYLVAMAWLPLTWQAFTLSFLLFRLLDIFKPFPISWVDRNLKGGVGIMADDLLVGLIVNLVMQGLYTQTMILGTRIG